MALAAALSAAPAGADIVLPSGGQVVAGLAQIGPAEGATLAIYQQSLRAVIDWQSFSIGAGARVEVHNGSGATLNRVVSGDPSSIMGRLAASGSVWLVNPAGIIVGPTGQVTTGGDFVASTRMVGAEAFMAGGSLVAEGPGGGIANAGSIASAGDVVLVGELVENSGRIASAGATTLAAAARLVLRPAGEDARIHIEHVAGPAGDVATSGRIEAVAVALRSVGGNVYALAADTSGVVRATGVDASGGRIRLVAGRDARVSGTLDASGTAGGQIDITAGERVILEPSAEVAARGGTGDGGRIRVGGARQGGLAGETEPLPEAQAVFVEQGAVLDAGSAGGRGGEVILWSARRTRFDGLIRADGLTGGGFVETSSRDMLQISTGEVRAGNGQWLLDPRNVRIRSGGPNVVPPGSDVTINPPPGAGAYEIAGQFITNALNAGTNVTITTSQPATADAGDITVDWTFNLNGAGSLTLLADNDILLLRQITLGSTGGVTLRAGRNIVLNTAQAQAVDVSGSGTARIEAGGNVDVLRQLRLRDGSTGSVTLRAGGNIAFTAAVVASAGASGEIAASASGSITTTQPFTNDGSGTIRLTAGGDITTGGAFSAAAAGSGSFLLDAGGTLTVNASMQILGSGDLTLIGRGAGIRFGGSGNRRFETASGTFRLLAPGAEGDIIFGRVPDTFGNMLWRTGGGALVIEAGRDVVMVPGNPNGRWVRIGDLASTGPVAVRAGREILGTAGTGTDNFVRLVSGGALGLEAGRRIALVARGSDATLEGRGPVALTAGEEILLQSSPTRPAQLLAPGPALSVTAPSARLNGLVRSRGDTLFEGGTFRFAVEPDFRLEENRSFTLASGARIESIVDLEVRAPGAGRIALLGPVDGVNFLGIAGSEFILGAPMRMAGSNTVETALVIAAGTRIVNTAGVAPLSAPNNRWLTYSVSPFDDIGAELLDPDAPNLYNRMLQSHPPAAILPARQSRRIYSFEPTLTLVAESASKRAGTEGPALGFSVSGLVPGDRLADAIVGTPEVSSAGQAAAARPGTYPTVFAPGLAASGQGYRLVLEEGVLTVNKALLSVVPDNPSKTYGQPDPVLGFRASGFIPGDDESVLSGALARDPGENVGTYAIRLGTLSATDYEIDLAPGLFSILPASLVVRADPVAKVYGAQDPALTFSVAGLVAGDRPEAVLSGALVRAPGEDVGVYAIGQGTLAAGANYQLTFLGSTLTIAPRDLQFTLTGPVARAYDATTLAPVAPANLQLSGALPGDDVRVTFAGATYDTPNVGTGKLVTLAGLALAGTAAGNYRLTGQPSARVGIITPAPLTVRALDAERLFGQPNPPFRLVSEGLRGTDTLASIGISATTVATIQSPPGFYPIEVVGSPLNYSVTRVPGTLSVLPLPLPGAVTIQQATVPVAGGLVQQGVATGVHAMIDTLAVLPTLRPPRGTDRLLRTTRYTISVGAARPDAEGLGGASGFDTAALPSGGR